jgi:serine/threonine-protein kinase
MLAGEPPFTGPSAQAIVARVMTETPRGVRIQRHTVPEHVEAAVVKALEKLPADRFKTAADFAEALGNVRFTLSAASMGTDGAAVRPRAGSLWNPLSIGASALAAILLVATTWLVARPADSAPPVRFRVMLDSTQPFFFSGQANPPRIALSPSGTELVYVGVAEGTGMVSVGNLGSSILGSGSSGTVTGRGANVLMHRRFSELQARQLPGTEGAWAPRFAPDGERVAFVTNEGGRMAIRVVSLSGGPPATVLDSGVGSAVSWGPGDQLYFLHPTEPSVYRVAAAGGPAELVTRLQGPPGVSYAWPTVLPGGKGIIVTARPEGSQPSPGTPLNAGLEVQMFDLASGTARVSIAGAFGTYSPTGHLVYVASDRTLLAVPFDESSLALTGRPAALIDGIDVRNDGITDVALAPTGTLAYTTTSVNAPEAVSWVTPDGRASRVDPSWTRDWEFEGLALSPDGRRAAVVIEDGTRGDVWIKHLDRGPLSRLTFASEYNFAPTWSPDGRFVAFISFRGGRSGVWMKAADGSGNDSLLFDLDRNVHFAEWSRDGRWMIVSVSGGPTSDDVLALRLGQDTTPHPVIADSFNEFLPALSPDGRWLAYVSDESGRNEIYLRPFPDARAGRWQLSTDGGTEPIWSARGRELYFRSQDRTTILGVDLARGANAATSRILTRLPPGDDFELNPRNRLFDVSPDGRFIMIQRAGATDVSGDLVVVLNWFEELKAKVGDSR